MLRSLSGPSSVRSRSLLLFVITGAALFLLGFGPARASAAGFDITVGTDTTTVPRVETGVGIITDTYTPSAQDQTILASQIAADLDAGHVVVIAGGAGNGTSAGTTIIDADITPATPTGGSPLTFSNTGTVTVTNGVTLAPKAHTLALQGDDLVNHGTVDFLAGTTASSSQRIANAANGTLRIGATATFQTPISSAGDLELTAGTATVPGGVSPFNSDSTTTIASGAQLTGDLDVENRAPVVLSGTVNGDVSLDGSLADYGTVSGGVTFTHSSSSLSGSGSVVGNLDAHLGGTVTPETSVQGVANLTIGSSATLGTDSELDLHYLDATASGHSGFVVGAGATLAGTLRVNAIGNAVPAAGATIANVVSAGAITGTFANTYESGVNGGYLSVASSTAVTHLDLLQHIATLTASAATVVPGGVITLTGAGYGAGETVSFGYNRGESGGGFDNVTTTADANGAFTKAITIPSDFSLGAANLVAFGSTTGAGAFAAVTVVATVPAVPVVPVATPVTPPVTVIAVLKAVVTGVQKTISAKALGTSGITTTVTCSETCRAQSRVFITASQARKVGLIATTNHRSAPVLVGNTSATRSGAGSLKFRTKLPAKVRALIGGKGVALIDFTITHAASGHRTTKNTIRVS